MSSHAVLLRQSGRYLWGGAMCALLHNALVIGLASGGIPYPLALVISFLVTVPIGYLFHSAVTFGEPRSWGRLMRFMAGSLAGFGWSAALMIGLHNGLGLPIVVATPLATVALFLWNFTAARWAIVRNER
ncbi:GtrA family protein [Sphingomonas segetis]|jgi:putative flippase GtrA|uniref:GtrA family protein n=1 Tax=Sphingomonas segetis TaxID=1104779 RepID=UPI0012D2BABA|nr:GtrA family protein [Sphingomonas segetis]